MAQHTQHIDPESGGTYEETLYRFDRAASYVESLADINAEQIAFFHHYGYLAVKQAFSPQETSAALAGMLDLINGKNPDFHGVQFESWATERLPTLTSEQRQDAVRKIMQFVDYDPRLQALAQQANLLSILRMLLGDKPVMFQDMGLIKPPTGGREKPWHQDKAFFPLRLDSPVVGVWIALDEASTANGCMHIIPGSHLEGPVVHFRRRDWQICDRDVQSGRDVVVPLPPGGCLFFDGLLHHGTPANNSTKRRRALQYHYTTPGAIWQDQQARLSIFGSEGKDVTC